MGSLIDIKGMKFGKWTVVARDYTNQSDKGARWIVICECGHSRSIRGNYLTSGRSRQCKNCLTGLSYKIPATLLCEWSNRYPEIKEYFDKWIVNKYNIDSKKRRVGDPQESYYEKRSKYYNREFKKDTAKEFFRR
jgi:hypothetical protein